MNFKLSKIFSNLFALSLAAPILSPYADGVTLYLYVIIPLIDPEFYGWIWKKYFATDLSITIFLSCLLAIVSSPKWGIQILCMILVIQYALYLIENNNFPLMRYINISIFFAVAQLTGTLFLPNINQYIGPTGISHMIWGSLSTITNQNFYAISIDILPRVSGLSREAGFLASLLVTSLLFYMSNYNKHNLWQIAWILLGLFISFSKISFSLLIIALIWPLRKVINKIPIPLTLLSFFIISALVSEELYNLNILASQQTFMDRFNGYRIPFEISLYNLIFGMKFNYFRHHYSFLPLSQYYINLVHMGNGISFSVLYFGLAITIIFVFMLYFLKIRSFPLIGLLIATFDVTPATLDSMVVVAWLYVVIQSRKINSAECRARMDQIAETMASAP